MGNYKDAWTDVKGLIDTHYPYPQHQGTTDITEVVEFQHIAGDWDLTEKQYDKLIDQAQRYHDKLDKKAKRSGTKVGDVWVLETPDEDAASHDLSDIAEGALIHNRAAARNYLKSLWPECSWQTIKDRIDSEGSTWIVWWMDGVRQHATNMVTESQPRSVRKSGKRKPKRTRGQSSSVRGLRR